MDQDAIRTHVIDNLDGVIVLVAGEETGAPEVAWGDTFFFYDPAGRIPESKRFPFATIVTGDYPGFDEESQLCRDGVFRLNMWVSRATFDSLFDGDAWDYTVTDEMIPHPVYAQQSWVSVVNPGDASEQAMGLLAEAHRLAVQRYTRRT